MEPLTVSPGTAPERFALPPGLQRIVRISSSLTGTFAATSLLGLLFWTLAARRFSVSAVGVGGAAVASMTLLGTLGTFGLGTLLIARLPLTPQGERRLLVRTSLLAAGGLALVLAAVVPVVGIRGFHAHNLSAVAGTVPRAALFAGGTALLAMAVVLDQAVLVLGSGALQLERNITASAVKVVALLGLSVAGQSGGMTIFLAWTIGTLVSLPLVSWRTRGGRALETSGRLVDRSVLRGLGRAAASHHGLNTTLQAPLQLLPLIVLLVLSARDNGVFSGALQVTAFVFALPYAISVGLFAAAEGDEQGVLARMRFTLPLGLGISVLANLVLFPLAPTILGIFGSVYSGQGTDVLRVLALAGIPFVVKDHFVALRRVQGRTGQATAVMLAFTAAELLAAYAGARTGGTIGMCVGWVLVLVVEALLLGVPLLRVAGAPTSPAPTSAVPGEAAPGEAAPAPARTGRAPALRRLAARVGAGPVLLGMACGLLAVGHAADLGREGRAGTGAQVVYVLGLAMIFLPAAVAVLLPGVQRSTRTVLAVAMPVLLQLTRVVLYPTRFVFQDELLHANVLRQINATGRLYSENPLLPISGYYPGLEIATNAVHSVTGLSSHTSSVVVLLAARVVLALSVLLLVEHVSGSSRAGAVAGVAYACNPQMLFFNSQFSYQTLALPLAVLTAYLFARRRRGGRGALVLPLLALGAVAMSHHVTAALLVLAFAGWWLVEVGLHRRPTDRTADRLDESKPLATMALAGAAMLGATIANPGNTLGSYLGSIVSSSFDDLVALARGHQSKALFANSAGVANAPWEEALTLASLALTVLVLIPSLLHARRWLRARVAAAVLLSLVALLYPIIPGGHLTRATAEVGDRSAGFVFVGVAFVVATWYVGRSRRPALAVLGGGLATITFLGSVVLGAGPTAGQLPGPYLVSADARSIDGPNLAAAAWLRTHVPAGSRVYADRDAGLLAAADGGQYTVRHISTGIDASRLLLSPDVGQADLRVLRAAGIEYLVVDRRDANGLPNQDVYIESGEFGEQGRTAPVPAAALSKFDDVPGVDRVYDNGSLTIYDMRGLLRAG